MEELRPAPTSKKGAGKRTAGGGGGWAGKAALVLSLLALTVSGVALYLLLFGEKEPEYLTYRDQQLLVLEDVDRNQYDPEDFSTDSQGWLQYQSGGRRGVQGIDVSFYQGEIDWQAVASSGVEFAMIRVGYRGYSQGGLQLDERFQENMDGALAAGLDVGVYFFSQAISVLEAEEEADFVLSAIRGYPIKYPVVFVGSSSMGRRPAPTGWNGETMTQCAAAFCELVLRGRIYAHDLLQPGAGLSVLPAGPAGRLPVLAGGV